MKENYNPALRWAICNASGLLYKREINLESKRIIKDLKQELKEKPELSVMIYGNHYVVDDPYWEGYLSFKLDPKKSREVFALVSASNTQEKEENKGNIMLNKLAQRCGVEMLPVVQSYQVDNPEFGFTKSDALLTYKKMILKIRELRGEDKKGVVAIIKPEGHRSEDGKLIKAEAGIGHIMDIIKPVIAVPIVSFSDEELERNHVNFGRRMNVRLGEVTYYDGSDPSLKNIDSLMEKLALALPPQKRGYYK